MYIYIQKNIYIYIYTYNNKHIKANKNIYMQNLGDPLVRKRKNCSLPKMKIWKQYDKVIIIEKN